jgi:hypothetical protein
MLKTLEFSTIDQGTQSGVTVRAKIAIDLAATWQNLWTRHAPSRPVPSVDFTKETAIAIFGGMRHIDGFDITVEQIQEEDNQIVVTFKENNPLPPWKTEEARLAAAEQPFHIVRIAKTDKPINFKSTS